MARGGSVDTKHHLNGERERGVHWNLRLGIPRDRDGLSTRDTCFNPVLILKCDLRDRDELSTRDTCFNPVLLLKCDLRDRDELSTRDTCFNPVLILKCDLRDRDELSTRDKTDGHIESNVQRFHCVEPLSAVCIIQ